MYQTPPGAGACFSIGRRLASTLARVGEQIGIVEKGGEVGQRAPHVAVDQPRHAAGLGSEALHPEPIVEKDGRDLDVAHQVQEIVVRLLEPLELLRELGVHGVELLVQGLRLLLGGLELLVAALELLVGRLHLLVRRGELLVGGLELGDADLRDPAACAGALLPAAPASGRRPFEDGVRVRPLPPRDEAGSKETSSSGLGRRRPSIRPTVRRSECQPPSVFTRTSFSTVVAPAFAISRSAATSGARKPSRAMLHDVQVGAAGGELEIGADAAMGLLDLTPEIDDDGRRSEALGEARAQRLRQVELESLGERRSGAGLDRADRPGRPAEGRPSRGGIVASEELPAFVEGREQLRGSADVLARAEQQEAARIQAVVEDGQQALLCARNDVDEEVPTGDQIHPRERRIVQDVLDGEHDAVSELLLGSVGVLLLDEEPLQTPRPDRPRDRLRIASRASGLDRGGVEVRREHLEVAVLAESLQRLEHHDGDRVGLFSRRAPGHPDAKPRIACPRGEQRREPRLGERLEGLRIPEESADADQPVPPERVDLVVAAPPDGARSRASRSIRWRSIRRSMRRSRVSRL